jgi:hypothetical protein
MRHLGHLGRLPRLRLRQNEHVMMMDGGVLDSIEQQKSNTPNLYNWDNKN